VVLARKYCTFAQAAAWAGHRSVVVVVVVGGWWLLLLLLLLLEFRGRLKRKRLAESPIF
jgi:hypothetical protein